MSFRETKYLVIKALQKGEFQHEARNEIDDKNLLSTGEISTEEIIEVIDRCNGTHHSCSEHHFLESVKVHVLKRDDWYIKFYFIDPDTFFISVHK
ncbi:MAG: hypothetical protein L3J67_07910 [Hyphomicrobiaceae bacterium]|nr:hypothetical protein [Hyphomicrobiaceae bacterium]